MVRVFAVVLAVVTVMAVATSRRQWGLGGRRLFGSVAVLAGVGLAVSTPMLFIRGESAPTVAGNTAIVALTLAAGLWLHHGLVVTAPRTRWLPKVFAAVLAAGLLIASTTFFLAIGAAIATLGALCYGWVLAGRPPWPVRGQGIALAATSITVIAAATLGDLSTEHGFEITGVVFSIGMGVSTVLLATTPTRARPSPDAS